jgi:hypothetical protein
MTEVATNSDIDEDQDIEQMRSPCFKCKPTTLSRVPTASTTNDNLDHCQPKYLGKTKFSPTMIVADNP